MNEGLTSLEQHEGDIIFIFGWTNPLTYKITLNMFPSKN